MYALDYVCLKTCAVFKDGPNSHPTETVVVVIILDVVVFGTGCHLCC